MVGPVAVLDDVLAVDGQGVELFVLLELFADLCGRAAGDVRHHVRTGCLAAGAFLPAR